MLCVTEHFLQSLIPFAYIFLVFSFHLNAYGQHSSLVEDAACLFNSVRRFLNDFYPP